LHISVEPNGINQDSIEVWVSGLA